jgi:hypothetical protein
MRHHNNIIAISVGRLAVSQKTAPFQRLTYLLLKKIKKKSWEMKKKKKMQNESRKRS